MSDLLTADNLRLMADALEAERAKASEALKAERAKHADEVAGLNAANTTLRDRTLELEATVAALEATVAALEEKLKDQEPEPQPEPAPLSVTFPAGLTDDIDNATPWDGEAIPFSVKGPLAQLRTAIIVEGMPMMTDNRLDQPRVFSEDRLNQLRGFEDRKVRLRVYVWREAGDPDRDYKTADLAAGVRIILPAKKVEVPEPTPVPTPPPSDMKVIEINGEKGGLNYHDGGPPNLEVGKIHFKGDGSHPLTGGVPLRIAMAKGGTKWLHDLLFTDTGYGLSCEGTNDEPIDLLLMERLRFVNVFRRGLTLQNFADNRPQPIYTAKSKKTVARGIEILNCIPDDLLKYVFNRCHGWYDGSGQGRFEDGQSSIFDSFIWGCQYGGLNWSQIHDMDATVIGYCARNFNIDGSIEGRKVPPVTGKITNSWSVFPHRIPVVDNGGVPRALDFKHFGDAGKLDYVRTIDHNPLDLHEFPDIPQGQWAAEAIRQIEKSL